MKTATIVILVIALTLALAGGGILIGAHYYARANGISPVQIARGIGGVNVGSDGVRVDAGPVLVDVDGEEDRVSVNIGPFSVNVDGSGVTINGRQYGGSGRSGGAWNRGEWSFGSLNPDYYGVPKRRTLELDSLDSVTLSAVAREIEITQGAGEGSVTLFERFEGEFSSFEERDGRLTVAVNDSKTNISGGFWSESNKLIGEEAKIILVLPAGALPDLNIESVSGAILLDGLEAGRVDAENVSGGVTVRDCGFQSTRLSLVSGALKTEGGSLGEARLDSVSGGIKTMGTAFAKLIVETVSGGIDLELPGAESDYTFDFESVSSRLLLNDIRYRDGSRVGSGNIEVFAGSVSGGVSIYTK